MAGARGGKRLGAGRKIGSVARASREQKISLSELARRHTEVALNTLVRVATKGESESAQVTAAIHLLDRGYGKPTQSHEHTGANGGPISHVDLSKATPEQLDALEAIFGPLAGSGSDDGGDPGGTGEASG